MNEGTTARRKASLYTKTTILQFAILLIIALLLTIPTSQATEKRKRVVITNNHTNYLSLRCFSFDTAFKAQHLQAMQKYTFSFPVGSFFPYATMYNCSTNMGVFIAYSYDDECAKPEYDSCDWMYDEDRTYHWLPKTEKWKPYDYNPNYESLARGGVIQGYYAN